MPALLGIARAGGCHQALANEPNLMLARRFQESLMRESRRVQSVCRGVGTGWPQQEKNAFAVRDFLFEDMFRLSASVRGPNGFDRQRKIEVVDVSVSPSSL